MEGFRPALGLISRVAVLDIPNHGPFLTVLCVVSLALVDFDHILDLLKVPHCIAERKLGTGLGKFLGA